MSYLKRQQGLTLIEIVIGTALLSSAMMVTVLSYTGIARLQQKGSAVRRVQQSGRYALETLARDIRGAKTVEQVGPSAITIDSNQSQQIRYTHSGEQIMRSVCTADGCTDPSSILAENTRATNLNYSYEENLGRRSYVSISFKMRQLDPALDDKPEDPYSQAFDLSTIVSLRMQ